MMNLRNVFRCAASLLVLTVALDAQAAEARQALSLDGVDDWVRQSIGASSPSGLDLGTFSVEAWIFPTQTTRMYVFSDSAYDFQLDANLSPQGVRLTLYRPGPGGFFTFVQNGAGFTFTGSSRMMPSVPPKADWRACGPWPTRY